MYIADIHMYMVYRYVYKGTCIQQCQVALVFLVYSRGRQGYMLDMDFCVDDKTSVGYLTTTLTFEILFVHPLSIHLMCTTPAKFFGVSYFGVQECFHQVCHWSCLSTPGYLAKI